MTERKIQRVAILVDSTTSWSRELIEGILEYSRQAGPWHVHLEPQLRDERLHLPENWRGDGIIARVSSHEIAEALKELNLPVINISGVRLEGVDYPRVMTNPESEAKLSYETFRSRGFHQFAYVGDFSHTFIKSHMEIYRAKVEGAGYPLHLFSPESGESLADWLKELPKPVGILSWGPSLGHQIIDACQLAGINVPHDVAVLGTNYDELLSEASYPPQAGIKMDSKQIGLLAASMLDTMMQGEAPEDREIMLEPKGVIEKLSIDTVAVEDVRMARVMRYISDHALEPVSVDDILRANPMARRSLERKFRQMFDCSIVEHIRQLRVNHARTLLADTDESVTIIAELCGFSSYNYLNRIFKNATGLTPSQFRAQSRAGNA